MRRKEFCATVCAWRDQEANRLRDDRIKYQDECKRLRAKLDVETAERHRCDEARKLAGDMYDRALAWARLWKKTATVYRITAVEIQLDRAQLREQLTAAEKKK